MKTYILKAAALTLVIGAGTYGFFHYDLHVYFLDREKTAQFINSFGPYSVVALILLQTAQVILAPIPGEVTGFISGFLYGPVLGTVYSTIGLTLGSWLAFMLARIFGLPLAEKIISPHIIIKYNTFMAHKGVLVAFALFLIPGFPKDALCYVTGLSHMRTGVFLVISTAGRLLGTIMLSVAGSMVRNDRMEAVIILAAACGVLVLLAAKYREKLLARLTHKQ